MRMHFFRDPLVNSGVWSFEQKNLGPRITDAEARAYFDPTGNDAKMTQMYMESCERNLLLLGLILILRIIYCLVKTRRWQKTIFWQTRIDSLAQTKDHII